MPALPNFDSDKAWSRRTSRKRNDDSYWPIIATKDSIPAWLQDNDYIINGNPMPTYSYKRSFRLLFCMHMETVNIWTHILGCAAFAISGIVLCASAASNNPALTTGDKLAFGIFITASATCFGLSATFHTLRSHSYNVHHFWGRLDIFGICLLALGAGTSATYYIFFCRPVLRVLYWTLNAGAASAAAIVLYDTGGGGSKRRGLRGGVFALLALTTMVPIIHGISHLGWDQACKRIGARWYVLEVLFLGLGVFLFVSRLPERLSQGRFDVWGHSHQLHHLCATIGTVFHLVALVVSYHRRRVDLTC
ncbi:HlyIII-domain-containing protein [Lophiostoma macrostomum CBS 122681]|uniref:HlyIII-domain-containing protein n=1 Tax=Lophiostoma macrostomum CBS 122681 TaxID=1314788 RepID=A0A6A6TCC4_9PLEO|nr:HlyIII-domain-containing protein [Lophiostoma macrostomum CBS 122681]